MEQMKDRRTQDLQLVLEPIVQRLQRLEAQESLIQQFYKQYGNGSFYMTFSEDGLGLSDAYIPDFSFPQATNKLGVRGLRAFDAGNPGQILGGRYAGQLNGGSYIPNNVSSGANENQFHIQGWATVYVPAFDPVFGVGPGIFEGTIGRIAFYTDAIPVLGDLPGSIVLQTTPPGSSGWNTAESTWMDSAANWQVGNRSRFGANDGIYSDGTYYSAGGRFNIYSGVDGVDDTVALTLTHALLAQSGTNDLKIFQKFMFKNASGGPEPGVELRAEQMRNYVSSGEYEASFAVNVRLQAGLGDHEYMRFNLGRGSDDRRMRLSPPNAAAPYNGGFVINYAALIAWNAAYKYVLVDPATGNLAVSAIGPAS